MILLVKVGSKSSDWMLVNEDTEGRGPGDARGRDWSGAATSQGMPRTGGDHGIQEEVGRRLP